MIQSVVFRIAAALVAVSIAASAPAIGEQMHFLYVPSGESTVIDVPGVTRLAIGDSKIAGVVPLGKSQVVINGKSAGHTSLFVWQGGDRSTYDVVVTLQSLDDYARVLRRALDEPNVTVATAKSAIVVSGVVGDMSGFAHISDVISRFDTLSKSEAFTVVNAVTVSRPLGQLQTALTGNPAWHDVHVDSDGKGNVVVSGSVHDRIAAESALERARGLAGAFLSADGKVLDRLATSTTTQIGVKVYILEVDDTGLTQLGLRLQGATPDPANPGSFLYGPPQYVGLEGDKSSLVGKILNVAPFSRITRLAPTLDAIITSGHAKVLSSPELITTPGQQATFLVGGEIPYAFATGLGQISIVFKEYGVKLDMTPKILGNGSVDTMIAPEVSDLDYQDGISQNGFVVPALKTSKLSTELITQPGESVVMGGLLRHVEQRTIDRMPILGDLPILGKLFRSTRYQSSQTDVVFVMTPEVIVR